MSSSREQTPQTTARIELLLGEAVMKIEVKDTLQKAGAAVGKAGSAAGTAAGKSAVAIKNAAAGIAGRLKENSAKEKLKK